MIETWPIAGTMGAPSARCGNNRSTQSVRCGKREYLFESRITKNGHKFLMITEKSAGRLSKVLVFHDYYEAFRAALEDGMNAEPLPASTASA